MVVVEWGHSSSYLCISLQNRDSEEEEGFL